MVDFTRLDQLVKAQGKKYAYLCELIGHKRSYISNARVGNGTLSDRDIEVLAKELGTTVAYLTGASDDQSPEGITQRDFDLLAAYHAADTATRAAIDLLLEKFQRT